MDGKNRTPSGAPTQAARDKTGGGSGLPSGSYPVFDHKSAINALNLRGHAQDPNDVINKVDAYADQHQDSGVKAAVKAARATSRQNPK
jgi:hypothetical protein